MKQLQSCIDEFRSNFLKGEDDELTLNVTHGTLVFIASLEKWLTKTLQNQHNIFIETLEKMKTENGHCNDKKCEYCSVYKEALTDAINTLKHELPTRNIPMY